MGFGIQFSLGALIPNYIFIIHVLSNFNTFNYFRCVCGEWEELWLAGEEEEEFYLNCEFKSTCHFPAL